ncbi:DNA recombination protein RmuC [Hoeflea prorocentri]|uniref:DNA recombination protein RmuC homolog n=1 Tax=Hoeflea prorocentri TaxID=1922333 RepID=A0A9X3ULF7_9HYPH|nr:DNA recombination protein RmuC [Hoeflea prorocentri]MCY6382736.1 DNA recombination protein RmuC [Hoeflea prorocentri]MDA5400536.1 DNA recombination protein RmuC [Hoeflea prorocentri]
MDAVEFTFGTPVARVGEVVITAGGLISGAAVVLGLIIVIALFAARGRARSAETQRLALEEASSQRARDMEARFGEIMGAQAEMQGRMATIAEVFGSRQSEINKSINERLDGMSQRIGNTISEQTKATHENLSRLQERLAVIDTAQNNIQALAKDVVGLQAILSNKQTRGAFGQARMETIIADALPSNGYAFQPTLSNGSRPDCMVHMPNGAPALVIDAKFPLEAWNRIRDEKEAEAQKQATQQFRKDIEVHIRDIADKYLLKGETQDTAFMFVPSESIFAEIHENFEALVQKAHRARIVIVSPSLLMLSLQVVQAVLKDARMREQAHLIQGEVVRLMEDVMRLDERVRKLQTHFGQAQRDIDQILTSTDKVTKRGAKIEALEIEAEGDVATPDSKAENVAPLPERTGRLKLHVND